MSRGNKKDTISLKGKYFCIEDINKLDCQNPKLSIYEIVRKGSPLDQAIIGTGYGVETVEDLVKYPISEFIFGLIDNEVPERTAYDIMSLLSSIILDNFWEGEDMECIFETVHDSWWRCLLAR